MTKPVGKEEYWRLTLSRKEIIKFSESTFFIHHSFIHIRLIKSLTYRKPYSNNKARKI